MRASQAFGLALMICTAACGSDSGSPAVNDDMPDAVLDASTQDAAGDAATDSAVEDSGPRPPELCSGCADESRDTSDLTIHLHHVHMNVTDRARSTAFYRDFFGAELALLNERTEALMAGPILLLLEEAEEPPSSALPTALQHVGWGSADPIAWFEDAHARGIQPDTRGHLIFATNETPTPSGTGEDFKTLLGIDFPACFTVNDEIAYVYVLGPDDERIELWSGDDRRVNHVHFTTADITTTVAWYGDFLDVETGAGTFFLDGVLFFFEPDGEAASYEPSESHVLGHVAFSVTDLDAWRERVDTLGIEVVAEPADAHGFNSFFVRGPDQLLIELVAAAPSPTLCPGGP